MRPPSRARTLGPSPRATDTAAPDNVLPSHCPSRPTTAAQRSVRRTARLEQPEPGCVTIATGLCDPRLGSDPGSPRTCPTLDSEQFHPAWVRHDDTSTLVTDSDREILAFVPAPRLVLPSYIQALLSVTEGIAHSKLATLDHSDTTASFTPNRTPIGSGALASRRSRTTYLHQPWTAAPTAKTSASRGSLWLVPSRGVFGDDVERVMSDRLDAGRSLLGDSERPWFPRAHLDRRSGCSLVSGVAEGRGPTPDSTVCACRLRAASAEQSARPRAEIRSRVDLSQSRFRSCPVESTAC